MSFQLEFTDGNKLEIGTIYGIGSNYSKHATEMGGTVPTDPVIFLKPRAAYISNGGTVLLPNISQEIHHEAELVVVISKTCVNISKEEAHNYIAGYAAGIDFTLRDLQAKAKKAGHPWAVAKGFYTSAPISKVIPANSIQDINPFFYFELTVNGVVKQSGTTKDMERPVGLLIEYLSHIFTLHAGDCIFTGTCEGVGPVKSGDKVRCELKNYTSIEVDVRDK